MRGGQPRCRRRRSVPGPRERSTRAPQSCNARFPSSPSKSGSSKLSRTQLTSQVSQALVAVASTYTRLAVLDHFAAVRRLGPAPLAIATRVPTPRLSRRTTGRRRRANEQEARRPTSLRLQALPSAAVCERTVEAVGHGSERWKRPGEARRWALVASSRVVGAGRGEAREGAGRTRLHNGGSADAHGLARHSDVGAHTFWSHAWALRVQPAGARRRRRCVVPPGPAPGARAAGQTSPPAGSRRLRPADSPHNGFGSDLCSCVVGYRRPHPRLPSPLPPPPRARPGRPQELPGSKCSKGRPRVGPGRRLPKLHAPRP